MQHTLYDNFESRSTCVFCLVSVKWEYPMSDVVLNCLAEDAWKLSISWGSVNLWVTKCQFGFDTGKTIWECIFLSISLTILCEFIHQVLLFEAFKSNRCDYVRVLLDHGVTFEFRNLLELYEQVVLPYSMIWNLKASRFKVQQSSNLNEVLSTTA